MDPACLTGVDDLLTLGDFNEPALTLDPDFSSNDTDLENKPHTAGQGSPPQHPRAI